MIAAITNHLWQSTLFVVAAAIVAFALRKNGAHVRHRIWLAASLKFLVPFSILMSVGGALSRVVPATAADGSAAPALSIAIDHVAQPFTEEIFSSPAAAPQEAPVSTNWTAILLAGTWAWGLAAVVLVRLRGWRRIRAAVKASVPLTNYLYADLKVRAAHGTVEPGVVGIWRPVLLVPAGIEQQLTRAQLDAVLAHEICHVQRRDNLTSAMHMVVESIFWFHPLVWIVGAKLIQERERACDEHVLLVCGQPQTYAESILKVCKLYVESPVACVSGVSGADLKRRVSAIVSNRVGAQLSTRRKIALGAVGALAVCLPIVAGMVTSPLSVSAAPAATTRQRFEVASIKPCASEPLPAAQQGGGGGGGGRAAGAGNPITSPGQAHWECVTLGDLMRTAYFGTDNPLLHSLSQQRPGDPKNVRGGPSWMDSEKFVIDAKAAGNVDRATLTGPMLRALLEDRFHLKTHRETEERSMYALTVAKNGLKVKRITPSDCNDDADTDRAIAALKNGGVLPCGMMNMAWAGGNRRLKMIGLTLQDFAKGPLSSFMDRFVVDQTGVDGKFVFQVEFAPDETTPGGAAGLEWARRAGAETPTAPSIFKALEDQLGLKLVPTKAAAEFVVIDHVEKPTPDSAPAQASSGFDVVSIKPCDPNTPPTIGGAPGRRGYPPWIPQTSPGYVVWTCATLAQLIDQAYADKDHPLLNMTPRPRLNSPQPKRLRGGPSWVEEDKFTIEVKLPVGGVQGAPPLNLEAGQRAGASAPQVLTALPAAISQSLRALLEDRFQLKVHRVTEQQEMYALTIAKSGLNTTRVTAPKPGDCQTIDQYSAAAAQSPPPMYVDPKICGRAFSGRDGGTSFTSFTLQQLAQDLSGQMDLFVLDRTGVTDPFNFTLLLRGMEAGDERWISSVAELGLKIDRVKAPAEYLRIDRAQKPRPDLAAGAVPR